MPYNKRLEEAHIQFLRDEGRWKEADEAQAMWESNVGCWTCRVRRRCGTAALACGFP